jgi:hypothetical protein
MMEHWDIAMLIFVFLTDSMGESRRYYQVGYLDFARKLPGKL